MALNTQTVTIAPGGLTFATVVPGQSRWRLLSVLADVTRAAGGTGTRAFKLQLITAQQTIVQVASIDNTPDPGSMAVCWTNVLPGNTTLAIDGALTIPFPNSVIEAGYTLVGTIDNPVAGDTWDDGIVWFDYTFTG